jgi:hypothetical protein
MYGFTIATLITIATLSGANPTANLGFYPMSAQVVEVNHEEDFFSIVDTRDHVWDLEEADDWMVNDNCSCIFCDNGTEDITDDIPCVVWYTR